MLIYLDSSVVARAYLRDEPGHDEARALIEGQALLVTSTLTLIEVTSALMRATQAGRVADLETILAHFHYETSPDGAVTVLAGDAMTIENSARQIVRDNGLRALDALHVAVADLVARPLAGDDEEVAFASRDDAQRRAASNLGFIAL